MQGVLGGDLLAHRRGELGAHARPAEVEIDLGRKIVRGPVGNGLADLAEGVDEVALAIHQHEAAGAEAERRLVAIAVYELRTEHVDGNGVAREQVGKRCAERYVAGHRYEIGGGAARIEIAVDRDRSSDRAQEMQAPRGVRLM